MVTAEVTERQATDNVTKPAGRFGKQDFVYIPEEDAYRCPADQRLTWRFTSAEMGRASAPSVR
jgi:hypothetical protein